MGIQNMKLNGLVKNLQGNPNLIAEYISNPTRVLEMYDLSEDEHDVLLSGSFEGLVGLGVSGELAAGVLSGAHSSTCGPISTRI